MVMTFHSLNRSSGDLEKKDHPKANTNNYWEILQLKEYDQFAKCQLLRLLGRGGTSFVFLGYDLENKTQVAIKILDPQLQHQSSLVSRFNREAKLSISLQHPHLVRGVRTGKDSKTQLEFMVMEWVNGISAQDWLENQGVMLIPQAMQMACDIANALEFLHFHGFVHRDIKPGNILLSVEGTAKLADLGVAKSLNGTNDLTTFDQGIGTPLYMPWEQSANASIVDARSDLFSLGATLYHLLTGQVPFAGQSELEIANKVQIGTYRSIREINPEFPHVLEAIVNKLLAKSPDQRFQSARELTESIQLSGLLDPESNWQSTEIANRLSTFLGNSCSGQISEEQRTQLDVRLKKAPVTPNPEPEITKDHVWYIRFRNEKEEILERRAKTSTIISFYQKGKLPKTVFGARSKNGRFRQLTDYPEFQSLLSGSTRAIAVDESLDLKSTPVQAKGKTADLLVSNVQSKKKRSSTPLTNTKSQLEPEVPKNFKIMPKDLRTEKRLPHSTKNKSPYKWLPILIFGILILISIGLLVWRR